MNEETPETVDTNQLLYAAGVLFVTGGRVLLLRRGEGGDEPGTWGLPAGKIEIGETALDAAVRETLEETGHDIQNEIKPFAHTVKDGVDFTTFLCRDEEFTPVICDESTDFVWAGLGQLPYPIHPGLVGLLDLPDVKKLMHSQMNELDLARAMQANVLPSPQKYATLTLFKIRMTGTGIAYRSADKQYVYKAPEHYLNEDFLERCRGLPVIWEHTDKKTLETTEYKEKNIGSVMTAFIEGNEVWCIARIMDDVAADLMGSDQLSTSPSVIVRDADNSTIALESGETVLLEGKPKLLDHLAICELGVWDKGGDPRGVRLDNIGVTQMTEDEKKAAEAAEAAKKDSETPAWFKVFADSMTARMDSLEKSEIAKKDSEDDKEKKDAKKDDDGEGVNALMDKKDAKKDSEDDKDAAKKDSAKPFELPAEVHARIAALETRVVNLSDDDLNALSEAQARADSVAIGHGGRAPRPMQGETPLAYRKRVAAKFKMYSAAYKDVDISSITDGNLFAIAESSIYKDAETAARTPADLPAGTLREHRETDQAGRVITSFTGSPSAWLNSFKSVPRRVTHFNK